MVAIHSKRPPPPKEEAIPGWSRGGRELSLGGRVVVLWVVVSVMTNKTRRSYRFLRYKLCRYPVHELLYIVTMNSPTDRRQDKIPRLSFIISEEEKIETSSRTDGKITKI